MAALHDLECDRCGDIEVDVSWTAAGTRCPCGGRFDILWSGRPRNAAALDTKEMTVVYEHPETGKVCYPGRNDEPMPERYRERGYVRKELRSLREVDRFSERHGVVNERAHYDRGSGRGYDSDHDRGGRSHRDPEPGRW